MLSVPRVRGSFGENVMEAVYVRMATQPHELAAASLLLLFFFIIDRPRSPCGNPPTKTPFYHHHHGYTVKGKRAEEGKE